jgi:hypothetical protein
MGLQNRKKSGKVFDGSKLNVPGQGIYNVFKGGVSFTKFKKETIGKPLPVTTTTTTLPITTTTTTLPINNKQFQDYEFFEFMDEYSYEFQGN